MTTKETADNANLTLAAHSLLRDDSTDNGFLASLEQQSLYEDAIRFLAAKMPVADGVKWALECSQQLVPADKRESMRETLDASDQWVKAPSDGTRWGAKDTADRTSAEAPANLIALAVYFSGGSIASPGSPEVQPPPFLAQKMIAAGIQSAVMAEDMQHLKDRQQRALSMGKKLV